MDTRSDQFSVGERFRRFLTGFLDESGERLYEQRLFQLGYGNPEPLIVDFFDLYGFDEELATYLVENPDYTLEKFGEESHKNKVRVKHLPLSTPVRELDTEKLGRFIMMSGIVVKSSQEYSKIKEAAYECTACGELYIAPQRFQFLEGPEEKCSCKHRRKSWRLRLDQSKFADSQTIHIQEPPDQLPPGEIPRSLEISLEDDLVGSTKPGDRVKATGIIRVKLSSPQSSKLELIRYLYANHVEVVNRELDMLDISKEDEAKILELKEDPWLEMRLINSIAPNIYGHYHIKKALMLQQFGSDPIDKGDVRIRGDINMFLCGDPGTCKSQFLQYAANLSQRGIYTTGRGSTAAGLTAAVIKDKSGQFMLEAGALVLADKGLCAIDEMEKMSEDDRAAIHPAMEQQIVAISKGGIIATLNARASIIAAANPKMGRYNAYQSVAENISNLPITLLSRFDLIFVIRDLPEKERDKEMGETILSVMGEAASPIPQDTLKKYIAYSKNVNPAMTKEVSEKLIEFYVEARQSSAKNEAQGGQQAVAITPRQLESLLRLTRAHARALLRETAQPEDADHAIELFKTSMEQVGIDPETGRMDIDLIELGKPRSLQDKMFAALKIVEEMCKVEGVASHDKLMEALSEGYGIGATEAAKIIGTLMRDGTIYSPRPGWYKRTD